MLAALAMASGLFTTLFLGASAETRLREAPGGTPGSVAFAVDLAALPYFRFETRSKHFDFKLDYAAEITQPDLEYGIHEGPQAFQLADLSVWYAARDWVFGATQGGGVGTMNFSYLTPYEIAPQGQSGPPPVQLVPCTDLAHCASEIVTLGSSYSSLSARYKHDRNTVALTPSYSVSGGLDEASKVLLPIVSVPRIDFVFEHVLGRRDAISTLAYASAADSTARACNPATGGPPLDLTNPNPPTCAPRAQWGGARETWTHRITRRLSLELTGGAAVARNEIDPSQPYSVLPYPVVGALVGYALQNTDPDRPAMHPLLSDPPKPAVYAYGRVEPMIDTHWGIVDPRLEIGAAILKPLDEENTLTGHVAFVRSLPPTVLDATYVEGEVGALHKLDRYRFEAGGGLRGAYQDDPFTGRFYVLGAYLTFVWHEPRIVF